MADLMDKIDILKLKEILEEKEMKFTVADINALMDAELEKSPEEMNTDLVDLCADILNEVCNNREKTSVKAPAKRRFKVGKILLVAAVVALLCAVAIPVGARFMPSEAADKIIEFCSDHFKIDLRGEEETSASSAEESELVNTLILESLHTLKLPEVLLSDEYEKNVKTQQSKVAEIIYVDIANSTSGVSGSIIITRYKNKNVELHNGVGNVSNVYKYFEQLLINDTDVLVFGNDGELYIKYIDENTEYEIVLNTGFDTAVKIAESIKQQAKDD